MRVAVSTWANYHLDELTQDKIECLWINQTTYTIARKNPDIFREG